MTPFIYTRATDVPDAVRLAGLHANAKYLAGGTNLVDLMREMIERPAALIDVSGLSTEIQRTEAGGLLIGAAAKNTALAGDRIVRERYPLLARAILAGASAQIRNMATVGGNIMQRTRCAYFYDDAARCNKRAPGAGCDAIDGFNRNHAILGASAGCIATHPSDMCVALAALDAIVHTDGPNGPRSIPLVELHQMPGGRPEIETELGANELITHVELPPLGFSVRSAYRKIRDRASYAFALVSVAAAIDVTDGRVAGIRIALGGVAPKPWRARKAEAALQGQAASPSSFRDAAEAELADAVGLRHNVFKIELTKRAITAVLGDLAGVRG